MIRHFIMGGAYSGKAAFARSLAPESKVCEFGEKGPLPAFQGCGILLNLQNAVRLLLQSGTDPLAFFKAHLADLDGAIITGCEMGCGIVPLTKEDRLVRDETGKVYQFIAGHAAQVTRMYCGIPSTIRQV